MSDYIEKPRQTEEMKRNGQVWVGINYPDGSFKWEIRGTGLRMPFFEAEDEEKGEND
jgi:hypothetical protein